MVNVACNIGIVTLSGLCHPEHQASIHVLEKCDFARDLRWTRKIAFPNLPVMAPQDVWCFTRAC
jgi:RimJ/RimL family protein N-acetyltransferase